MLAEPRCLICRGVIAIPAAAMFNFYDIRHAGLCVKISLLCKTRE
jgi:hypothetical protein